MSRRFALRAAAICFAVPALTMRAGPLHAQASLAASGEPVRDATPAVGFPGPRPAGGRLILDLPAPLPPSPPPRRPPRFMCSRVAGVASGAVMGVIAGTAGVWLMGRMLGGDMRDSPENRRLLTITGMIGGVMGIQKGLEGRYQPAGCHLAPNEFGRPRSDSAGSSAPRRPPSAQSGMLLPAAFRVTADLSPASSGAPARPV